MHMQRQRQQQQALPDQEPLAPPDLVPPELLAQHRRELERLAQVVMIDL